MAEIARYVGEHLKRKALEPCPFGPGFSREAVEKAAEMVLTGSSFDDPGEDWTEFQLIDGEGNIIASRRLAGY